jgi:hypothetical protein
MNSAQLLHAAEQARRLGSLNQIFEQLRSIGETHVSIAVRDFGGSAVSQETEEEVRADRLLRVIAEEINAIVDELSKLGIEGLSRKQIG